jgi:hypothetical protein
VVACQLLYSAVLCFYTVYGLVYRSVDQSDCLSVCLVLFVHGKLCPSTSYQSGRWVGRDKGEGMYWVGTSTSSPLLCRFHLPEVDSVHAWFILRLIQLTETLWNKLPGNVDATGTLQLTKTCFDHRHFLVGNGI